MFESLSAHQHKVNIITMQQTKQPVEQYYYSESEWDRLGCGALPAERDRSQQSSSVDNTDMTNQDPSWIKILALPLVW